MARRPSGTPKSERSKKSKEVAKRIKRASELPVRFRALIYGRSGAGKTRLAATAPKPLLIDINEEGTASTRNDTNPHVIELKLWTELSDIYWYLQEGDHPYETVVLDGLTAMQEICMKFVLGDEASRDASRDPDMPHRQAWGKLGELMKTQITNYRNLPMNVVFTATDRKRVVGDEDDDEVEITIGPALSPAVAGAAERAVGLVGYLHKRQVVIKGKEGKKTTRKRVVKRRLLIDDPTERFQTKDRYYFGAPFIDAPDVAAMIRQLEGESEA